MYLVTYDITDKKRLKRVAKLLLRYGHRVQKSVFVCDINERRCRELAAKLGEEKQSGDSIVIIAYKSESADEIGSAANRDSGTMPRSKSKIQSKKKRPKKKTERPCFE